jgi:hypothetical protein
MIRSLVFYLSCFKYSIVILVFYWGKLWHLQKRLWYLNLIHSCHHSPLSCLSSFLQQFQQDSFPQFHVWIHNISTIFSLLHPFLKSSPFPMVPIPRQDLIYIPVLCENRKGYSLYMCILSQILSSPSLFSFLPYSSSDGELGRCKYSIFALV